MAFHVACPITCKKICFCNLGFPKKLQKEKSKAVILEEAVKLSRFVADPLRLLSLRGAVDGDGGGGDDKGREKTVQVLVPKVVKPPPVLPVFAAVVPVVIGGGGGGDGGEGSEADAAAAAAEGSAQIKRVVLQKNAAVASLAAEDFARRFESGDIADTRGIDGEEQGQFGVNVMCRMCFYGEIEGSERARRMLSCKCCGKKYHRSCIKSWAQHRDLFHWSSWTCPSCRICELCRRTGDPNKFLFCKRCDSAYHCYCQHPPHKNVSAGPYLCTKHTRCHSCGSNVPGNGLSVRWFLGYTCCDACGRLFVKGNYCPVCLKVYRDSESTPMVCCDICERWVHCECDGIGDERYQQYQADGNLQYQCATCRGECYEVKDLEDAVRELWSRRDEADRDLIANERAAAGLPTQEEIFSITPYSDDEEDVPTPLKNEFGRSLKFSMKGMVDKSSKKMKERGKKSSNKNSFKKKEYQTPLTSKIKTHEGFEDYHDPSSYEHVIGNSKNKYAHSHNNEGQDGLSTPAPRSKSHHEGISSNYQPGSVKHKFGDGHSVNNDRTARTLRIKSDQTHGQETAEDIEKSTGKSKTVKGPKLVIHLGSRNKNVAQSPRTDDALSIQKEQELVTSNGSADTNYQRTDKRDSDAKLGYSQVQGDKVDNQALLKSSAHGVKEGASDKVGKIRSELSDIKLKYERRNTGGSDTISKEDMRVVPGKRSSDESTAATTVGAVRDDPMIRGNKVYIRKHPEGKPTVPKGIKDNSSQAPSVSQPVKDSKPMLKLKFKNPYHENQSSWVPLGDQEKTPVKGQRSKRKRSTSFMERFTVKDDEHSNQGDQDQSMDEIMDANWILKKLGKDAVGKRVEVHMPSDNSWHKGLVANFIEGTSVLTVDLDDGRLKTIELGKQGIRFVSQQKRPKP